MYTKPSHEFQMGFYNFYDKVLIALSFYAKCWWKWKNTKCVLWNIQTQFNVRLTDTAFDDIQTAVTADSW